VSTNALEDKFKMSSTEWKKLEYLIDLTLPFAHATTLIGTTKGPSLHLVLRYYNTLFNVLDKADKKLKYKTEGWKKQVHNAITAV
jgi:hypothetical protein